jgi:hypothetical protein
MKIKYLGKGIYNTSTNLKEYYIWKIFSIDVLI